MAGPDALERFTRYADLVGRHLGDLIDHTCTINEPQIVALFGHLQGHHPPGRRDPTAWRRVTERFKQAHAAVADLVPSPGLCLQMPDLQPARPGDPAAEALTRELDETMIETYLDGLPGSFVGVQYYTRMRVDPGSTSLFGPAPPGAPLTQMGWELHPEGLHRAIMRATATGLRVIVTENGVVVGGDAERVAYLGTHLAQVKRARDDGADVRGSIHWSSFDNFEWSEGHAPRFGLVAIDRDDDLRRTPRPSDKVWYPSGC